MCLYSSHRNGVLIFKYLIHFAIFQRPSSRSPFGLSEIQCQVLVWCRLVVLGLDATLHGSPPDSRYRGFDGALLLDQVLQAPVGWVRKVFWGEATWNLHAVWKCLRGTEGVFKHEKFGSSMGGKACQWIVIPLSGSSLPLGFLPWLVLTMCHVPECVTLASELPHTLCRTSGLTTQVSKTH